MTLAYRLKDDLGTQQLQLIERARVFLAAQAERGVDVAVAPECYLNGWARVPGNARLQRLAGQSSGVGGILLARARDALNVARQSGYEVAGETEARQKYDRIVISWSRRNDFAQDGSYNDRYFRISSRDTPDTLWFLVAIDQFAPETFDPNIRIFHRRLGTPELDILFLLRFMTGALSGVRADSFGSKPALSVTVAFAEKIVDAVNVQLHAGFIRDIVVPYEGQPFQHAVLRAAKHWDSSIRTVGYLHSALPPMPTDLIYRAGAPDILLVHGSGQGEILTRHLGWPKSAIKVIQSLRYRVTDTDTLGGTVFLPYSFGDPDVIEGAFREFLIGAAPRSLPLFVVRNHPVMQDSVRHTKLRDRLQSLMRQHADRFANAPSGNLISVFIGATAAIIEALERGVVVVDVCSCPLTEAHCPELWAHIVVQRLGENVFRYELAAHGVYIDFGNAAMTFERFLN